MTFHDVGRGQMPGESDDDLHLVALLWFWRVFIQTLSAIWGLGLPGDGEVSHGAVMNFDGFFQLHGASDLFPGDASRLRFISATAAAQR